MAAYAPVGVGEGLEAHLVPQVGLIDANLVDDLRVRPRCSVLCALISCLSLGVYAFASWDALRYEKHEFATGNYTNSMRITDHSKPVPISTNAEVSERFLLAVLSEVASFLICVAVLGTWKCSSRIPITWSMLCYFVFRGCTLGAVIAVYLESWGINAKMTKEKPGEQSTLRVACTMIVVGLAEETGKIIALSFNVARRLEEVGSPDGCCRLCRTLVGNPKSLMIAGVATGCGFMILENFEYFFINAVTPDLYGPHDDPHVVAAFGDFSRIYTAVTRNLLNPHPLFTGLAAGYMCEFYYGPHAIPIGGTLSFYHWCSLLGVSVFLHASFDFFVSLLGNWVNDALTYVLLTLFIQLFWFVTCLALVVRQWKKICTYTPG